MKYEFSHLKPPPGWENIPKYTEVEFLLDFDDPDRPSFKKTFLVPPTSEYLTLQIGDVIDYERGNGWALQPLPSKTGTAVIKNIDYSIGPLDKVVIHLESVE